jgi:HSP20 family protein
MMADRSDNQHAIGDQASSSDGNTGEGQGRAEQAPYDWFPTPLNLARRFDEDLGRLFLDLTQARPGGLRENAERPMSRGASWTPTVEVTTRGDDLVIRADVPGVLPEDIQVEIDDNTIVIRGESRQERENKEGDYLYSERSYGSFYSRIPLPAEVNTDNARAQLNGAALEVVLPGGAKVLVPKRRPLKIELTKQSVQQTEQSQQTQQEHVQTSYGTGGAQQTANSAQEGLGA